MATATLTKTERFVLDEIWSTPEKKARSTILRVAARLTITGFNRVERRMAERRLIAGTDDNKLTITFAGMQALGVSARDVA